MIESELRQELSSLVSGDVSLDVFEDWFALKSWNYHKSSSADARRLVGAVELRLAEHSSGHLMRDELLGELEAIVLDSPVPRFASSNNTISMSFTVGGSRVAPKTFRSGSMTLHRRVVPALA